MTLACGDKGAGHNHTRSCTLLSVSDLERIKLERPLLKAVRPGPARLDNAPRPQRGFTLVEILVVMAIILLIAALVIVALVKIYKVVKTLMSEG